MGLNYSILFNCFHGTIKHYADKIITDKEFTFEERNNHWLGNGVYFFINDRIKADWWSITASKKAVEIGDFPKNSPDIKGQTLYVEATVPVTDVLDLDVEADQKKLESFRKHLDTNKFKIVGKTSSTTRSSDEHEMLCSLMDLFVVTNGYKASCYTFNANKRILFKGLSRYGIGNKSRQLCIYNQSIIDFNSIKVL